MHVVKIYLSFFLLTFIVLPQVNASNKDEQINLILIQTGFDKLVQHLPEFAQAVLKQSSGALEPQINSALSSAFEQAFAEKFVQRDINQLINAHFNNGYASAYLKQRQLPLHTKMAELERSTSDPANRDSILTFKASLQSKPASNNRQALIRRLDVANQTTEFSVDMQSALFKAIFIAIDPVMEADMRLGDGELEKMVNEVHASLEEGLRSNTRLSYLYAFRDITDAELEKYIELCESEEYRWVIQLLGNAMLSAINQAADRAALIMRQASQ